MVDGRNNYIVVLRREYRRAQFYGLLKLFFAFAAIVPGIVAVFNSTKQINYFFGLFGLLCLILWGLFSIYHSNASARHKLARKLALLEGGLGGEFNGTVAVRYISDLLTSTEKSDKSDKYYSSDEEKGYLRLWQMVEESAFYSEHTHRNSFVVYTAVLVIYFIVFFALILVLVPEVSAYDLMTLVRAFLAFTIFLIGSEVLGSAIKHKQTADECRVIQQTCASSDTYIDALNGMFIMSQYTGVMDKSPETIGWVFRKKAKLRIEAAWKQRNEVVDKR